MKIADLDEGRSKYLWSDFTEMHYQVLLHIDEFEWRVYHSAWPGGKIDKGVIKCGGSLCFLTYVDGVPTKYDTLVGFWGSGAASEITAAIKSRLQAKYDESMLPCLTYEQFRKFEDSHSWSEVDGNT